MTAVGEPRGAKAAETTSLAEVLRGWRVVSAAWRLSRGDAARLLRVRRDQLVGTAPDAAALTICADRMRRLLMLADLLERRTRSPAHAARWIRFPCISDPARTRLHRLIASDRFLDATLTMLGLQEPRG